jgi:iron complex outermembrane receptor protein
MLFSFNLIIIFAVMFFSSFSSAAPPNNIKDLINLSLEELSDVTITTASKYAENIDDTPSTVIVITQQQIEERGYTNLLQVLESLPSIDVQRYASQVTAEQISIRGIPKNNGFLILQDGIRISSPVGEPIPIHDNFPIYNAKQIEIMYGPASVMYGADALTAVINIITETGEELEGATIKGTLGENNTYSTYLKAGKKMNETITISAGGHYKESNNTNLAKYYPNDFVLSDLTTFGGQTITKAQDRAGYRGETKSYSAYGKLNINKDLDIGVNYSFDRFRSDVGEVENFADYSANAYLNTELGIVYANYKLNINKALSGFLRANYAWYRLAPESRYVNKYDDYSGGYKYAWSDRQQIEGQLQYQLNQQHIISSGFSFEDYYSIPITADLNTPYDLNKSPEQQTIFYSGTNNSLPVKIQHTHYHNMAGYLQWNATWNEMFSTSIGARYDTNSTYNSTFNPKLGLVFKPFEKLTTKLLYGSAFLAPSPFFSYRHYGSFSSQTGNVYISDFFHIPNPSLKPETIHTFELSADYRFSKQFNVGINSYWNTLKGVISSVPTPTPVSDYISGGIINFTQHDDNIGKLVSYGGDIHFDYQHSFENALLKLWGSYSHVNGQLSLQGQDFSTPLPIVASNKLKLGLTYIYQQKYIVTPTLYWIGKTTSSQPETNHPQILQSVPSYWKVDLYAKAKIMNELSLFLNINNLFNRRYYNSGDFYTASMIASPQDSRIITIGFNYQFK